MPLADTPKDWPNGSSISDLHVILLFAGVPLLVIVAVFLLILGPGWVRGPRYRPGQPWEADNEWFGSSVAVEPPGPDSATGTASPSRGSVEGNRSLGGASAGW